jgi:hypothetical protein
MLQKWFAQTSHPAAKDPYFLYVASNAGSMGALLAYPLLFEPFLRLKEQAWAWTGSFALMAFLISACAFFLWKSSTNHVAVSSYKGGPATVGSFAGFTGLTVGRRAKWVLLSFAPSSMLLGITTFITTDIASVPLLWVMPLAIYLLTFILVFARRPTLSHNLMVKVQPFLVLPVMMVFLFRGAAAQGLVTILLHIFTFFVTAMVCHGELVRSRPPAAHLTEFYLWLAVGGVLGGAFNSLVAPVVFLGGAFNSLVAPVVFDSVAEYPMAIVLACLLRPPKNPNGKKPRDLRLDFLLPLILFVMLAGLALGMKAYSVKTGITGITVIACLVAVFCYSFAHRPIRFGTGLASVMLTASFWSALGGSALLTERSFFGVHEVSEAHEGRYYTLYHGTTLHGAQSRDPARHMEPLTYYHREGPIGQVFETFSGHEVAVVGLGTGSMAGYAKPGEHWTFFEIDPVVVRIASDPRYFTFLKDSPGTVSVVLGDARLKLEDALDGQYDLIVLDAFNSDAIPVHLVTKEALELYLAKLADNGIIAFHVSNRYLDLETILGDLALDAGLFSLVQEMKMGEADQDEFKRNSTWVVMAREAGDLKGLADDPRWGPLKASGGGGLWTDDFSNIISVLK